MRLLGPAAPPHPEPGSVAMPALATPPSDTASTVHTNCPARARLLSRGIPQEFLSLVPGEALDSVANLPPVVISRMFTNLAVRLAPLSFAQRLIVAFDVIQSALVLHSVQPLSSSFHSV